MKNITYIQFIVSIRVLEGVGYNEEMGAHTLNGNQQNYGSNESFQCDTWHEALKSGGPRRSNLDCNELRLMF